jgi:manganese oxidase
MNHRGFARTVLVRLIQGAQEENHIFFMNGAKWLAVPDSKDSGYRAAQHIGISEHFELNINVEEPNPKVNRDLLYGTTATDNFWDGQWGLMRVVGTDRALSGLPKLPNNTELDLRINADQSKCKPSLPKRSFKVEAWRIRELNGGAWLNYHNKRKIDDPNAVIFVSAGEYTVGATPKGGVTPPDVEVVARKDSDLALIKSGAKSPEPLILRARAGECIEVELANRLGSKKEDLTNPVNWSWNMMPPIADGLNFNAVHTSNVVGLHAPLLAANILLDDGSAAGFNDSSLVYPCDASDPLQQCGGTDVDETKYQYFNTSTYHWYAGDWKKTPRAAEATLVPVEFGAVGLQNFGDVIKGSSHGSIGALIVEPLDAEWTTDCQILRAAPAADKTSKENCLNAAATVTSAGKAFREFVLLFQNDVSLRYKGEALANLRNGDDAEDSGQKAFNYRFEPFWSRLDANPAADPETMMDYDYTNILSSKPEFGHGDPGTPLFTANAGTPLRIRLVQPAGHPRNGGFTLSGHDWTNYPWKDDSTVQTDSPVPQNRSGAINAMGPGRHENILIQSAGGTEKLTGDFLYRTPLGFAFGGGQWGIMRVFDPSQCENKTIADARTGRTQVCE